MVRCEYCGKKIGVFTVRYTWLDKQNKIAIHDKCIGEYNKNKSSKIVERQPIGELTEKADVTPKHTELKKGKKLAIITVVLIVLISTISLTMLSYEENRYALIQTDYNNLQDTYNSLQSKYNSATNNYNQLQITYNNLQSNYNTLQTDYNNLYDSYHTLYAPSTLIQNGTIHWRFRNLDGTIAEWTMPVDTYRTYIDWPEPTASLSLSNTNTGETYTVKDLREYVQPDFFTNVISGFTDGKTDKQFVQEVVNFKDQIITYGSGLGDFYRWPAETMTEGRGQCGDTTILVASLLKAGENRAHYGLSVYIWYCDAYHMTSPQTVNHAIVEVKYADGTDTFIETTSNTYYTYNQVTGWSFQV
ncbi:MAG: hypothetical protein QHH19_01010 [Candidatus Thermoplasmatota archaeon]|jgi:hypothetical protein|nr:hypothetical protein [Candidatus Thermoplasmatota archaeon]